MKLYALGDFHLSFSVRLAMEGADVVLNDMNLYQETGKLMEEVKSLGRKAIFVKAHVSRRQEVKELEHLTWPGRRRGITVFPRLRVICPC